MFMPTVVSVLQYLHQVIRIRQYFPMFTFSTQVKHGKMFVVVFQVFGSVSGRTAVHFFEIDMSKGRNISIKIIYQNKFKFYHA